LCAAEIRNLGELPRFTKSRKRIYLKMLKGIINVFCADG